MYTGSPAGVEVSILQPEGKEWSTTVDLDASVRRHSYISLVHSTMLKSVRR